MYCTDWPISSILVISPIAVANVNYYYYYELQMDLYWWQCATMEERKMQ